jgi:ribonuclease III
MARRKPDLGALEERIGHRFQRRELLTHALTHMSAAKGVFADSYQRLEFLGDRVLGLAIADMLYEGFRKGSEGDLSRRLSELVRRETCAAVAQEWELGPYLKVGGNEAGIRTNRSVLADVCEAVIAAVFLDGG